MPLVLLPLLLLVGIGLVSLCAERLPRLSHSIGSLGAAAASLVGLGIDVAQLAAGTAERLTLPWNATIGASFSVGLDPLSGFFLLPLYALSALCALFGYGYMRDVPGSRRRGAHWLSYCVLVASMALVIVARNAVLFLVAWELMSVSSWVLVTFEHDHAEVRDAGITYLVATQIGTAFLVMMFLLLGAAADTPGEGSGGAFLDFARLGVTGSPAAGAAFLLALVGFGTKAGIVPLHVWLPEAHPAAPTHVSALMSGVMIKTGIYGLLRILSFLGSPPAWWGWTLLAAGAVSGIVGVLFALAQHDIKRLLAYHSVENIGIICMGMGIGMLGESYGAPVVAALGFAGALLHVANHALFKGLLFLGGGAAASAAGTREIDRLGGLLRRMPLTGAAFLVGSVAICGLPPLNGFVSELLVFAGAFKAVTLAEAAPGVAGVIALGSLALISGLAAACFTKAFGIVFLGEARTPGASSAVEKGPAMVIPLLVLAAACAGVGVLGWLVAGSVSTLAASLSGSMPGDGPSLLAPVTGALLRAALLAAVLAGIVAALTGIRVLLQRRLASVRTVTWDCGYGKPTARMQYSSSSFAQPLAGMFRNLLGTRKQETPIAPFFPAAARFSTETPDVFSRRFFLPGFRGAATLLSRFRWLQHGRLQLYVLYIAAALVVLLVWRLV